MRAQSPIFDVDVIRGHAVTTPPESGIQVLGLKSPLIQGEQATVTQVVLVEGGQRIVTGHLEYNGDDWPRQIANLCATAGRPLVVQLSDIAAEWSISLLNKAGVDQIKILRPGPHAGPDGFRALSEAMHEGSLRLCGPMPCLEGRLREFTPEKRRYGGLYGLLAGWWYFEEVAIRTRTGEQENDARATA